MQSLQCLDKQRKTQNPKKVAQIQIYLSTKKKNVAAYNKKRESERKKHYNRQAESTRNNWDKNREKSESWRENQFHNRTFSERLTDFFDIYDSIPNAINSFK